MRDQYTDRDCLAALICLAACEKQHKGRDIAVYLPSSRKYRPELVRFCAQMGVRVWEYSEADKKYPHYMLERVPACYGGGVRPARCDAGETGHSTIRWWHPSAGLGPGATTRRQFCDIVRGVLAAYAGDDYR